MLKSTNFDVVKEGIRALGMVGREDVIKTMLSMFPEIYNRAYLDDSGKYDFEYLIKEVIEEIMISLECLVGRGVVETGYMRNLVQTILINRKTPERMLEIFSLERWGSSPINEIEDYLMDGKAVNQEEAVEHLEFVVALRRALAMLTPREEKVVKMRFGIDGRGKHSWAELGELFDVSQSTIKKRYKDALKKLRNAQISEPLGTFYNDYQGEGG
jgi:RNA polymerase sigma factor (sigma-70 family)